MSSRSSSAAPLKKRPPPPPQQDDETQHAPPQEMKLHDDTVVREMNGRESLDLEDDDARGDWTSSVSTEERRLVTEGQNRGDSGEDDVIEEIIEVEEEVEVDDEEGVIVIEEEEEDEEERGGGDERREMVKERRKRKEFEIFVGGLDRNATEDDLRKVFSRVGEITEVRLMKNPVTQRNKGFAFLRFATVEQAKRALNELKHPVINGKQCGAAPCEDNDTLFVGNICRTWTKENLKDKLARYGVDNYEDLTLVWDSNDHETNRGFAFIDFRSREYALEACKRLQRRGVTFGTDRIARVEFAASFVEPDDEIMSHVTTVFIDGLSPIWDEDRVSEHLKKFGKIEKVELARNMPAAKRKDFGFITFDTHDSALACIDNINTAELCDGDKKVKVRARLCRPRQRGKSAKRAQGAYPLAIGSDRSGRSQWGSTRPRVEAGKFGGRSGRRTMYRDAYEGGLRRSVGSRESRRVPDTVVNARLRSSPRRSYGGRSPVASAHGEASSNRYSIRQDEYVSRSSDFGRAPMTRYSHRDGYPSYRSRHLESPPRSHDHHAAHGPSSVYDDYSHGKYGDNNHGYSSTSGSKRPHSAIDRVDVRYAEYSIRHPRDHNGYEGSSSRLTYGEKSHGRDNARVKHGSHTAYDESYGRLSGHSDSHYDSRTSSVGYKRDFGSKGGVEKIYSSYEREYTSRDYVSSRSDLGAVAHSTDYPRRHLDSEYRSRDYVSSRSDLGAVAHSTDYPRRHLDSDYLGSRCSGYKLMRREM